MSERFEFTQTSVRSFDDRPSPGKRLYVYCSAEKGLSMAVSPGGSKTFFYHGRIAGKPERIPLGRFPETSVKLAKSRCVQVRAAIEQGRDPRLALTVSRRRRGDITLEDFFTIWYDRHATRKRKRPELTRREFQLYCSDIADQPLRQITHDMLAKWHERIAANSGQPTANKAIKLLSSVFSKAMIWERPDGSRYAISNPASAKLVERFDEESRDRFMTRDEIADFWKAAGSFDPVTGGHFFIMALATGQRKASLMSMRYENIDTYKWIWLVPLLKGGKKNHPVPLIDVAQEIITIRQRYSASPWVFPGRRRNGKPIQNVDFWWSELCDAAGLHNLRIHDLRRTLASYMTMAGASVEIVSNLLAHTRPGPTQIYARLDVEPVRRAIEDAFKEMHIGFRRNSHDPSSDGND